MQHFKTLAEYSKAIGIKEPLHPHFDVRRFEDNRFDISRTMLPFRHEFYFIAIQIRGEGMVVSGHNAMSPKSPTVYFNTPFQIQSWEIQQDWSGYYIIFSQDFISSSHYFDRFLEDFPFLKMYNTFPLEISEEEQNEIVSIYQQISDEYYLNEEDKFRFIEVNVLHLLHYINRLLRRYAEGRIPDTLSSSDQAIYTRFQELIELGFCLNTALNAESNPHSTSYYASKLNIHPNYLNAVVKSVSGLTALQNIQNYILKKAKESLIQTALSAKEIAYNLHFSSPGKFSTFFKKLTGVTPMAFRKETNI
ncbi:helix-turn-helix domain-containing protein [Prolixibacteraceae bacterium]|nr:helix-turn-helix domain-containing protein [Prolixibacteraceae bacterium]